MTFTRNLMNFLGKGFGAIKDFICSPWNWACDGLLKVKDTGDFTNDVMGAMCEGCPGICCCKAPIACTMSAITVPVGCTSGIIFGALGGISLLGAATVDAISACCPGPNHQQMHDDCSPDEHTSLSAETEIPQYSSRNLCHV